MRKKFIDDKKEKTAETSGRKNTLKLSKEWEEQYIARTERREKELFGGKSGKIKKERKKSKKVLTDGVWDGKILSVADRATQWRDIEVVITRRS